MTKGGTGGEAERQTNRWAGGQTGRRADKTIGLISQADTRRRSDRQTGRTDSEADMHRLPDRLADGQTTKFNRTI